MVAWDWPDNIIGADLKHGLPLMCTCRSLANTFICAIKALFSKVPCDITENIRKDFILDFKNG